MKRPSTNNYVAGLTNRFRTDAWTLSRHGADVGTHILKILRPATAAHPSDDLVVRVEYMPRYLDSRQQHAWWAPAQGSGFLDPAAVNFDRLRHSCSMLYAL